MKLIDTMSGHYKLMFSLLYGYGLRKAELLRLRIKDIDFESKNIFIFRVKGAKDRITILPDGLVAPLPALDITYQNVEKSGPTGFFAPLMH